MESFTKVSNFIFYNNKIHKSMFTAIIVRQSFLSTDAEISEVYEPRKSKFSYVAAIFYLFYTFALLYLLLAQLLMGRGDISQVGKTFM